MVSERVLTVKQDIAKCQCCLLAVASQAHQGKHANVILLTRHDIPTSPQCRTILVDFDIDRHTQVSSGRREDKGAIFATGSVQWAIWPNFDLLGILFWTSCPSKTKEGWRPGSPSPLHSSTKSNCAGRNPVLDIYQVFFHF